ncbi:MAG: bifunctional DNA primase/polymerase, partial [Polyangiaceae bacterium]
MNARGLATGERSGVIVVDVDDLTVELPSDYPKTFAVKTNRGVHRYFRAPEGIHIPTLKQFPCPGVDLRGRGGYVVCEGSGYEVAEDIAPADCPKSLLEAIAEYELARMQKEHTDHHPVDLSTPFGQQLLRQATIDAKTLPVGGPGNRDDHLWRAALTVVRSRGMPVDTAIELLNTHYAPRVSEDGRDTVSPLRVEYKCNEAARV